MELSLFYDSYPSEDLYTFLIFIDKKIAQIRYG